MTKKSNADKAKAKKRAPEDAQAENLTVEKASNLENKVNSTESGLLKLPAEIKQRIWTLAIAVDESIKPIQIRERSNKFIWSEAQDKPDKYGERAASIKDAPPLTVVALSKVCRTLYEEVSLTRLFYKVNHFEFPFKTNYRPNRAVRPITYLVALTTPRMKALRSITCDWPSVPKEASKLFTVLAACDGLQSLELVLHPDVICYHYEEVARVPGLKEALIAVEGLQTLKFKLCDNFNNSFFGVRGPTQFRALVDKVEPVLNARMKEPRGTSKYNLETFLVARRETKLDIHGDGRLGEDKKPGLIASRTRNQLRNLENLDDDGTVPKRVLPKYDAEGDLAWHVDEILDSRRSEPVGFPPSVEFQVKCYSLTGIHYWQKSGLPAVTSWEDINVLQNFRQDIVTFYHKNPSVYGKEAVIEAWNLRDQDSGMSSKDLKHWRALTKRIEAIAERQEKIELREAEAAAAAAAKEAKKVKKAKTTRSKNVNS